MLNDSAYLPSWVALICILGAALMWYLTREQSPAPSPEPYKDSKGRLVFSFAALQRFDGRNNADKKMYMGLKGKVYDVTKSRMLGVPGEHYAKIWAGKDCTVSMCLLSLKPEDANRTDWDEVQKEKPQYRKALLSWVKHFHDKYPVVGYVEEYIKDGRDLEAEDKQDFIEIEVIEKAKAAEKAAILEKKKKEAAAAAKKAEAQ
ncbi:membrane-associated progesterone receptor component, putative [Perkinsus marinus ATCC 50983]|uniref:Membrane-associated progesterone receptor component, putative n=1 Tax=Perkinsus marinus (strain ATCC 50983 / TXsc) TaxID=423536 RepID=C5K7L4_PERM5|nr:membrane-associated progesterone receptor component, putative [Perkinsus marinus ATCC 50983]EER19549.1 membrane-associated progesterone receptor component, putative [Perkinsus marinus ATCC 50983]|eukprot:XP_002787753.1 membrane-associated progesterone receptor component, putative [Perkinsus marinus ATCC 50983]